MAAPTAILYNGNRIIPAPQLNFNRSHRRSDDKSIIGTEHTVTLTGNFVGCKGWDFSSGDPEFYQGNDYPADQTNDTCDKFKNILLMQEEFRNLFSVSGDYEWFEVIGCDGLVRKWLARTISIDFPQGQWTQVGDYSVTLELQTDEVTDEDLHIDHNESWEVQFDEENGGIYTLNHTLSTQSEEFANTQIDITDGWENAKTWIDNRLAGSDYTGNAPSTIKNDYIFTSTGFNLTGYTSYDYTVQKTLDEYGGTYSVTETWTLAKDPVFRKWNVAISKNRDDYTTVSVDGTFSSFLDRTESTEVAPTNGSAALTAFNTWVGANGPYTAANSLYVGQSGCGTLGTCPVNSNVTIAEESRGDGTSTYGEETRQVNFSYEFSDSDADAEVSISKTLTQNLFDSCENTISISGNIQGHTCDCETSKLDNAKTAYEAIDCSALASTLYSDFSLTGNLGQTSSSYTENERDGTIEFTCEFTDKFDENAEIKNERTTISWTCGDLKTGGESKTVYSVEGTIRSLCSDTTPTAPDPSTYNCSGDSCCELRRKSVTTDATNNSVSYNYEWDNDCGPGLVEIIVDTSNGPDNCGHTLSTVDFNVQGTGCDSETMLANANSALASLNADDYVTSGSCITSIRSNVNRTRGSIRITYTYTTECDATLDVTITENYEQGNCEDTTYTVEGEIKGRCYASGGAMAAAEALFASHGSDDYSGYGCLASSRISRNERTATIRFTYEYRDCEGGYEHEQSVTTKTDEQDCCTGVDITGTIIPYCDPTTGESGQVDAGEAAWVVIEPTLITEAGEYCTTPVLRGTNVSRNKKNGQIQYTYNYQCCDTSVSGATKESVSITREYPASVVAIVPVLGRTCGPIVQDKGTKTTEKCSVAIDLLFPKQCGSYSRPADIDASVATILSNVGYCEGAYETFTERDTENWNPKTGKYTRNVTFICACCDEV